MTEDLSIRQFNIREADWQADGSQLSNIRRLVFIVEQKVPKEEEWDDKDGDAWHWIATSDYLRHFSMPRNTPSVFMNVADLPSPETNFLKPVYPITA